MTLNGIKLLKLMFNEDETICVSNSKYGYHSIPFEEILKGDKVTLVPTPGSVEKRNEARALKNLAPLKWEDCFEEVSTKDLTLVALNPIKGFREDQFCYKYRNFLVEIDTGELKSQLEYVKSLKLPYSAVVFSGNKSLHFLVSLEKDLPDEKSYRKVAEWILNCVTLSDPNTKNPSRSIRLPDTYREPGKLQRLVEFKGKVKLEELQAFLLKHPNAEPREREKRSISDKLDISRIKTMWVCSALVNGLDPNKGRNVQWFAIACEFALANYSEDDTIEILSQYYAEENDFKEREWLASIRSGYKYIRNNR